MVTETLPEHISAFTAKQACCVGDRLSHDGKVVKQHTTTAVEGKSNRYYVFNTEQP